MSAFTRFGPEHLGTLAGVALLAWLLARLVRGGASRSGAPGLAVRGTLAAILVGGLGFALVDSLPLRGLDWLEILPLHLCDLAVLFAVWALLTKGRFACEMLYFWGLTGTLIAMITPDVDRGFPDTRCLSFFALHGVVAASAVVMTFGAGVRPRPGSHWRVFAITNAYALLAAAIDLTTGANYLYLRAKPSQPSILDAMGPWPWYIVAADVLALFLFWVLMLPFRRGASARAPGGAGASA
ncbi:MAG TPA: TIGR02206 family membrane protein [Acidobacteriota bacterium]|nr:TIGR02206 family membrane protein [Acidobacteriota bacterium]